MSLSLCLSRSLPPRLLLLRAFFFSVASGTPPPPETCEHVRFDTGVPRSLWPDATSTIPTPTAGRAQAPAATFTLTPCGDVVVVFAPQKDFSPPSLSRSLRSRHPSLCPSPSCLSRSCCCLFSFVPQIQLEGAASPYGEMLGPPPLRRASRMKTTCPSLLTTEAQNTSATKYNLTACSRRVLSPSLPRSRYVSSSSHSQTSGDEQEGTPSIPASGRAPVRPCSHKHPKVKAPEEPT